MELMHYASKYYDPVKAHEYYEAHKKLKGRTSTAGFNQMQKESASYVKKQLTEERKNLAAQNKEKTASEIERKKNEAKSDLRKFTHNIQTETAKLKILLESGKLRDDPQARYEAITEIKNMRKSIASRREELMNQLGLDVATLRSKNQEYLTGLKDEYDQKYIDELAKIRGSLGTSSGGSSSGSSTQATEKKEKTNHDFTKVKKEQTSTWARQRERRREKEKRKKALGHSDVFVGDGLENMSDVIKKNELYSMEFGDLNKFAHSLLEME